MTDAIFRPYAPSDAERSDRSAGDRARHRMKVRESIRENIADIIAEESIIGQNRDRVIKVPIRGIREYRFVYGDNTPGVGQGDGDSESGQVIGKARSPGTGEDKPVTSPARTNTGPTSRWKSSSTSCSRTSSCRSERKASAPGSGVPDVEAEGATARSASASGSTSAHGLERLRGARWPRGSIATPARWIHRPRPSRPVPGASRSTTTTWSTGTLDHRHAQGVQRRGALPHGHPGSMDTMKKYLARSFFFLLYQFICTKYRNVEIAFVAHHGGEGGHRGGFFHKGESAAPSSRRAYLKALGDHPGPLPSVAVEHLRSTALTATTSTPTTRKP
jgi:hypothetical protein